MVEIHGIHKFLLKQSAMMVEPRLSSVATAINRAMDVYATLHDESKAAWDNPNLSPTGKRGELRQKVADAAHEIVRVRKAHERAKDSLAKRLEKLKAKVPPIDKTDAATAVIHQAIRDRVAKMSAAEKNAILEHEDPVLWQAVLAAPNMLTGITNDIRQTLTALLIEHHNPGELAKIQSDQDAIITLGNAAAALADFAAEVAFDSIGQKPDRAALNELVEQSCPDTRSIEAQAARDTESLAA